jgi:hypothetical protein
MSTNDTRQPEDRTGAAGRGGRPRGGRARPGGDGTSIFADGALRVACPADLRETVEEYAAIMGLPAERVVREALARAARPMRAVIDRYRRSLDDHDRRFREEHRDPEAAALAARAPGAAR